MYLFIYFIIFLCKRFWASEVKGARPCLGDIAVSPPYCPGIGTRGPSLPAALLSSQGSEFKLCAHSSGTSSHQQMPLLIPWFPLLKHTHTQQKSAEGHS